MQHAVRPSCWSRLPTALALLLLCASATQASANPAAAKVAKKTGDSSAKSTLTTTIGMEGIYYARYSGGALEVRPFQEDAPITLSIGDVTPVVAGDGAAANRKAADRIYELHYIGTRAGHYDLRDNLVRVDGRPLTDLEPLRVSVAALLPTNFDGDLESPSPVALPRAWPYRAVAAAVATIWVVFGIWFVAIRWKRRTRRPSVSNPRPLTLADQLRPLVASAIAGELTATEQAQLECLLIGYWRSALGLDGLPTADALAIMRRDRNAGELLRQIEIWLYERRGRAAVDVAAILAPYENIDAVPSSAVASSAAPSSSAPISSAKLPVEASL